MNESSEIATTIEASEEPAEAPSAAAPSVDPFSSPPDRTPEQDPFSSVEKAFPDANGNLPTSQGERANTPAVEVDPFSPQDASTPDTAMPTEDTAGAQGGTGEGDTTGQGKELGGPNSRGVVIPEPSEPTTSPPITGTPEAGPDEEPAPDEAPRESTPVPRHFDWGPAPPSWPQQERPRQMKPDPMQVRPWEETGPPVEGEVEPHGGEGEGEGVSEEPQLLPPLRQEYHGHDAFARLLLPPAALAIVTQTSD